MRISQRAKYRLALPMFIVAAVVAQLVHVIPTYAATLMWTGAGDGTSFSDTANWNTGQAPVNGDVLTFSVTGLSANKTLNNDISNLSVAGITFNGTMDQYYSYTLQGNALTVAGPITNAITGSGSDYSIPRIENNLTLGANVTATSVNLGTTGSTLNLQNYALTISGGGGCGQTLSSDLSGSGALNLTGTNMNVRGANGSYTGPISVTGAAYVDATSFGAASAGTTVSGSGSLDIITGVNVSVAEPLTLGGSGFIGSDQNFAGCAGGAAEKVMTIATGGVTLTSNFLYKGFNNFTVNDPYTSNGHTFTVAGGSDGTLTTPQGQVEAPTETIPLDGDSSTFVNIGNKQTGVLNGTRDSISVADGGTLKGTGTANNVYINDGGQLSPGNSPGTITVLQTLSISGTYNAELLNKDTYDKAVVGASFPGPGNAVNLYSGAKLNTILYSGWNVHQGDTFTIIDNKSATPVSGTFEGLAEGAKFVINGITFSISYVGGDGNDVVLTALNTGTDPNTPNTGMYRLVTANPALLMGLGVVTAGVLIAIALRRKNSR